MKFNFKHISSIFVLTSGVLSSPLIASHVPDKDPRNFTARALMDLSTDQQGPIVLNNDFDLPPRKKSKIVTLIPTGLSGKDYFELGEKAKESDPETAIKLYAEAARENYEPAVTILGCIYYDGLLGQEKDYALASRYFEKAEFLGNVRNFNAHSLIYIHGGHGVVADPIKAIDLIFKAAFCAEYRDKEAMNNIGAFYEEGTYPFPKSLRKAEEYYRLAVKIGSPEAVLNLQDLLKKKARTS